MPFSVTRWNVSDKEAVHAAVTTQLDIHKQNGDTDGAPEIVVGPDGGIPEGQYECARFWTNNELAQSWVNYCGTIGITMLANSIRDDA